MKVYQKIASLLAAIENCKKQNNAEWQEKHESALAELVDNMPSGSGFDNGTKLDESSSAEKIIFNTSFHHMNDVGMYDGWSDHTVTVTGSMVHGFTTKVSGPNKRDIKDYIAECFESALSDEI